MLDALFVILTLKNQVLCNFLNALHMVKAQFPLTSDAVVSIQFRKWEVHDYRLSLEFDLKLVSVSQESM